METAWGLLAEAVTVAEAVAVTKGASPGVPVLAWVPALVRDWAQVWAQPLQRERPQPVAGPSDGHRPHGPKQEPRLPPRLLQELVSAPAVTRRELDQNHLSVPASARGWASAPALETPQPVVRTS